MQTLQGSKLWIIEIYHTDTMSTNIEIYIIETL